MKREEKIILWARQWAEYVSDEEVLKKWKEGIGLLRDYGELHFDLRGKK